MMRKFVCGAALAALCMAQGVAAQKQAAPKCLTRPQAEKLVVAVLPALVRGAQRKCAEQVAPTASLYTSGNRITKVFQPAADAAWPEARKTLPILTGSNELSSLDDVLLRPLFESIVAEEVAGKFEAEDCDTVDQVFDALLPLPPENFGKLFVVLYDVGKDEKPGEKRPFTICADKAGKR
ncbi:MAG: hypothetical protein R3E02_05160 [Blastomonas sp.]